jgi:hypothetical protein
LETPTTTEERHLWRKIRVACEDRRIATDRTLAGRLGSWRDW